MSKLVTVIQWKVSHWQDFEIAAHSTCATIEQALNIHIDYFFQFKDTYFSMSWLASDKSWHFLPQEFQGYFMSSFFSPKKILMAQTNLIFFVV